MFRSLAPLALVAGLAVAAPLPAAAQFTDAQKAEIGQVMRDYLLKNPQVLREALVELQKREKEDEEASRKRVVGEQSEKLFNSKYQAVLGNPKGTTTIVEFFDYNCGYCKRALDDMAKLMKSDPELRVVLKDFPVLGPGSVEAAQVAQAVKNQLKGDKFWEFHSKLLLTRGQIGKAQAMAVAKEIGVDMAKLDKDMASSEPRAGIAETMQLADSLGLTGTPSYVVGQDVVVGAVGYDELAGKLANVRKCGATAC